MELKIEHITRAWSDFTLKDINLTVKNGEYFIILGPTGAGKTLLLETIMGFYKPDTGKIILNGQDITETPTEKRNIGYAPQNGMLFPHMTVRQNIEFGPKMQGTTKETLTKNINQILETTQTKSIQNNRPATLSGGEKQRVILAQVLAANSKIILLDEPLASIDTETSQELKKTLKTIHAEHQKTIIHVTHNLIEAFSLGDKIAIMKGGEIIQTDTAKNIFAKPQNEFTARFLGYENIYRARIEQNTDGNTNIIVEGTSITAAGKMKGQTKTIAIRPEDISITTTPDKRVGVNTLKARIIESTDMGPYVMITAESGLTLKSVIPKNSFIEKNLETGREIYLHIKHNAIKTLE